jgi:hypothetical protein
MGRGDQTTGRGEGHLWIIDQDDFGGALVRHRHQTGTATAYVLTNQAGRDFARCTECGMRLNLAPSAAPPGTSRVMEPAPPAAGASPGLVREQPAQ